MAGTIDVDTFAKGVQQALGRAPIERVSSLPQRPLVERMVAQIDQAWPPPRTSPYPTLQQNDPLVVLFGPMLSADEATQVRRDCLPSEISGAG